MAKTTMQATRWRMYAHERFGMLTDAGSRNYVTQQRLPYPVVEVDVTLVADWDKAATHWAWMPKGEDVPEIIWPTRELFECWFFTSSAAEERAGHGRVVRLAVHRAGPGRSR